MTTAMRLFMDRHDLPGATAEDVARAHLSDLQVATKHGVRFLAYWFDAERQQAFCLARSAHGESLEVVHREAHGMVPNEIIEVSEDQVLRFLGRISDPADETPQENPFRIIVFTDLEGSTALLQAVGEAAFMVLLTEHDLIVRRALVTWRGREVKHTGDGFMISFEDVGAALRCAIAIQDGFEARAAGGATPVLRVRIGIAAGEPVDHNDDLFGSTVTLASRICDVAEPGRTLASQLVRDLGVAEGFTFGVGRASELKGFAGLTPVYELVAAPDRGPLAPV